MNFDEKVEYPPFCEEEFGVPSEADALFHVIPCPLETSVSFGHGTAKGPSVILQTSNQLEPVYLGEIPGKHGTYVKPTIPCNSKNAAEVIKALSNSVETSIRSGKIPIALGGEHTITLGAYRGIQKALPETPITILQIDAHADLREVYDNNPLSHACVIRRIHEEFNCRTIQLGVRGISSEEVNYRSKHSNITSVDASEIWQTGIPSSLFSSLRGQKVYVTFDIDGLDCSLMPATGTPSPGGLLWHQIEAIFEQIKNSGCEIVGCDLVEFSPMENNHAPNFTACVALYALMHLACHTEAPE